MDDHRIEEYLKSFRPLSPAPLPQRRGPWTIIALVAAAALVLGVVLLPQFRRVPSGPSVPEPITIGSANHLLSTSLSWKNAIEDVGFAFRSTQSNAAPLRTSALELLSKEDLSR